MSRSCWFAVLLLGCHPATPAAHEIAPDASAEAGPAPRPVTATKGFTNASAECSACISDMRDFGPCAKKYERCVADAACAKHLACIDGCSGPAGSQCFWDCAERSELAPLELAQDFLFCACCRSDCLGACQGTCSRYRSTGSGPVGAGCLYPGFEQQVGACNGCVSRTSIPSKTPSKEYKACLDDEHCFDQATCAGRCRDRNCIELCRLGPAAVAYLETSCIECDGVCSAFCRLI